MDPLAICAAFRHCAPLAFSFCFDYIGNMEKLDALAALSALAQESRLDVFRLLVQAGAYGIPAGRIGDQLGLPSATLSFHLNHLKQSGLVKCRRESRSLIYSADYTAMNALLAYLTENCCRGDESTCGVAACQPALPA